MTNDMQLKKLTGAGLAKGLLSIAMCLYMGAGTAFAQAPAPTPRIGGNVFGGGRMADVKQTTAATAATTATINIYASTIVGGVFGGNDVKGEVQQGTASSATITIHDKCNVSTSIAEVYGGGNGYYEYVIGDVTISAATAASLDMSTVVPASTDVKVYPVGASHDEEHLAASFTTTEATTYADLMPTLTNTSVVIGTADNPTNNIALGEVYGGAKNAYVTGTGSVTVESGTIGKVFAGNNYGGSVATAQLTINGTSGPASATEFAAIDWAKVGDWQNDGGFGIGEAYGGGNAVDVTTGAGLTINAGYAKTIFGGNNLADMTAVPVVMLNGGNVNTAYGGGNAGSMVGMKAAWLDVSQYISNDLFLLYPAPIPSFLSNNHFLYFYSAETLVEQAPGHHLNINTIYGGCRAANVNMGSYTRITNADYVGTVFGGCDISGSVAANPEHIATTTTEMDIEYYDPETHDGHALDATKLPANFPIMNLSSMVTITGSKVQGDMFAGGNGDYNYVENGDEVNVYPLGAAQTPENLLATIAKTDYYRPWVANATTAMEGGALGGNMYGGGNNATVGRPAVGSETENVQGRSYVFLGKTKRGILVSETTGPKTEGSIYAGGKKSDVYGTVDVLVKAGCDINKLYAGNDIAGQVDGSNRSNFTNNPATSISTTLLGGTNAYCGEPLDSPFGVTDNKVQVYVRVEGAGNDVDGVAREAAKIEELYGGGNGDYDYDVTYAGLSKPEQHSCWLDIKGDVVTSYGGGNAADVQYSNTYITGDANVTTAFAGGNSATVTKSANLWLNCEATRGAQAYVDGSDPAKIPNAGTIFGGNNVADMNIVPRVNLLQGAAGTVYGGGNKGDMKGYEPASVDLHEYINNNSFDAFNQRLSAMGKALSTPLSAENFIFFYSTGVVVNGENLAVGTLYGGCRAANLDLSSYVRMQKAAYIGDIYGGCDIAGTVGKKGNCKADGTGADGTSALTAHETSAMRYDPTDPNANAQGVVTINIPIGFPMVNTASYVRILAGKVDGNVYGGGNGDYDYTSDEYREYATNLPNVFAVGVSLEGGQLQQNLYGGGNKADVGKAGASGNNYVLLGKTLFGTNYESNPGPKVVGTVYAGGKMADVYGIVDVLVKENTYVERLFAGNDISGSVQGNARATSTISSAFPANWSTALVGGTNSYNDTDLKNFDGNGGNIQVYVRVEEDAEIKTLFGGGNGDYGEADGDGKYTTGEYVGMSKPEQSSCWLDIKGNVKTSYGGGNAADVDVSNTYITGDAVIETAFAGGNSATVTESANLWLNCDGTRASADIVNYTHDDVADDPTKRPNVFTIFGGNNIADMNIVPKVELNKGSVNTVYGGGKKGAMRGYRGIVFDVTGFVNPVVLQPMSALGMNTHNYPDLVGTMLYVNAPGDGLFINKVYGGCMAADVDYSTYVHVNNVQYLNTVYGGCDIAGAVGTQSLITPTSNIGFAFVDGTASTAVIPADTPYPATGSADVIITGGTINGKIFGGGNGEYTYDGNDVKDADGNLLVTLDPGAQMPWVNSYNMLLQGGDIQGTVYGGGNKATVGKDNGAGSYTVMPSYLFVGKGDGSDIDLSNASVFAGGRMAAVYGPVDVMVKQGATVNTVYAGNDISGSVEGAGRGDFPETFSSDFSTALYHFKDPTGANPDRYKSFNGTSLTNYDGAGSDIQIYVRTEAGSTIKTLFGGGNGDYDYTAGDYAGLEKPAQSSTWLDIAGNVTTAYGGGNAANIDRSNLCVIGAATVGTIYGGCKAADVTLSTHVFVDKCAVDNSTPHITGNVFGGCDISGNVGLEHTGRYDISSPSETIGHARVQILAGQIDGRVFGGGNGLQDAAGNSYGANALASGTIAGGDDVYAYTDGTYVGKPLPMVENTWVTIKNATIGTTSGSGTHTVFGGGQGAGTRVIHNVDVEVGTTTDNTTVKGINYGGSYAGFVNTNCDDHTRTIILGNGANTKMLGDIYGGSYGNYVRGKIMLNINNVAIGEDDAVQGVYVGNNNAGQPECDASLDFAGNNCNVAIYGGGNMAEFCGTTRITFTHGHVGYIYGGGNNADVYGNTIVEVLGGHVCHDVFGGGNNGAVRVNKASDTARNKYSKDYGGNTLVIVRNDCLNITDDAYDITKEYAVSRNTSQAYRILNVVDPDAEAKQWYELKTSTSGKLSDIKIDGNVYGGGNAADVEGKTMVIIGQEEQP